MSTERPDGPQDTAVRRCLSVIAGVQRELAELVQPVDGGTALLTPSLPLVFDANLVRLLPRSGAGATDLAKIASRLAVEHRLAAVTVCTDDPAQGRALAPGFATLDWEHEQHLLMLATGPADRPPHRWAPVSEVAAAQVTGLRREWLESLTWAKPEVVRQFQDHDRRTGSQLAERCFAVRLDREVVSYCRLLSRAGVARIEDVTTSPLHRNKGYARAAIDAARRAAEQAGARDVFLIADAAGWPRLLYERLGFSAGRVIHHFRSRAR